MSHTVAFTFPATENREAASQDISPYDEGAVHDSFHQLIEEQSWLAEQEEVEMQNLAPRGRENLAYTVSPPRRTEAWEAPGQMAEHPDFSSATLRILASMPSRTIGRSRGAVISQYCNRTARLRRKSTRAPLQEVSRSARPSIRQLDLDLDSSHEEEDNKRSLLVKELRSLPASQRISMLRTMPLSLGEKCKLRQESSGYSGTLMKPKTRAPLSHCSRLKYHIIIAAYPPTTPNSKAFTGLEPLTGAGYFNHTLMYYGYYSNFTLNDPCAFSPNSSTNCRQGRPVHLPYNMPLAYVLATGVSFFVTCLLLVYSMSHSFGESYRVDSASGDLAIKVFCAWDYKVIQKRSVRLQSENICTHLKECLAERRSRSRPLNLCKRLQRLAILLIAWTLSLGIVLGCVLGVHYFSIYIYQVHHEKLLTSNYLGKEALLLALPLLVSLINFLIPYIYNLLAAWEKQESPVLEVYVAICRNLILKMVILGLLCYHWLSRKETTSEMECWENFVGQELYRLVVMDFIFCLLDTFFAELMWRVILEKKLQSKRRPEFDIARNVLELIYGQTLTWLGVFFAPLLPVVQIFKLLLLFYIKKTSLMRNCQSPSKPWRASHMSTIFITLLCFPSFLGASIFLSYTIWAVKPSKICGPFRDHETIYESGKTWVLKLEKSNPNLTWFTWIHQHLIQNSFFLFLIAGILLAVIYLNFQVVKGQRKIITLLKEQIANVSGVCFILCSSGT
ncbi:transmembrane channel 6 [Podarcis lilfordi]|uniref:Transmembrane channel-like protein n=1 Tax=Podarcis lilfordi TaxID=74358 RepID=A0AA35JW81_9SAUR|nr:transmembrane channel 6 [Podarcis lilfordi]